mgnify:CR=1 FL=1
MKTTVRSTPKTNPTIVPESNSCCSLDKDGGFGNLSVSKYSNNPIWEKINMPGTEKATNNITNFPIRGTVS